MLRRRILAPITAVLVSGVAAAQVEIIHYNFDAGDATNSATGAVGDGIPGAGVGFASGGLCPSASDPAALSTATGATCQIDTTWVIDVGMSDWTIGMWVDQTPAGNGFQYFFGNFSGPNFRCFGGTGGNMFLGIPPGNVVIVGGASPTVPRHLVWVHDSALAEVRGYLDGVLNVTFPLAAPLDMQGVANFPVMRNGDTASSMLAGNIMDDFRFYRRAISQAEIDDWVNCNSGGPGTIGTNYCGPAVANSTGLPGVITATGSTAAADNDVTLEASDLPQNQFGYFLNSMTQAFVFPVPGSEGALCLGGQIGRYNASVFNTGAAGTGSLVLDLASTPTPTGTVSIAAGETWNFSCWFRDNNPGPTSNFTDGLSIAFN